MSLGVGSAFEDSCVLRAAVIDPAHAPPRDFAVDGGAFFADLAIGALDLLVPSVVNAGSLVSGSHEAKIPHKSVVLIRYTTIPPRSVLAASASIHASRSAMS